MLLLLEPLKRAMVPIEFQQSSGEWVAAPFTLQSDWPEAGSCADIVHEGKSYLFNFAMDGRGTVSYDGLQCNVRVVGGSPGQSAGSGSGSPSALRLVQLNKSTARLGKWVVKVCHSKLVPYRYQWNGREVENRKVMVYLVSEDAQVYCVAVMKGVKQNWAELDEAE